jgi:alpha/beta superfamily hydrolase
MMPVVVEACRIALAGGATLEARFSPGSAAGAVVASPHPLYGGSIDNPVVMATVAGLQGAGVASMAFNYRGIDRSEGTATDSLEAAVTDYTAAFHELRARTAGPYFAAGYSFGAGTALLMARDTAEIAGVVLVAPPLRMLHAEDLRAFAGRVCVVLGDDDEYAPVSELSALLAARPDATLTLIPGADHFFHFGGLSQLAQHIAAQVRGWL